MTAESASMKMTKTVAGLPATSVRPMTGAEYVESIRDGREIYLYGERVKDVTLPPALRNSVRMTARLYDALRDPKMVDVLTCPADTGNGCRTMRFFRADALFASARDEKLRQVIESACFRPAPKQEVTAERLGLSFGTYRRHLATALGRLARWLWESSRA